MEIIEEAKQEEKVTVEAFGTGKTGFIDLPIDKEEGKQNAPEPDSIMDEPEEVAEVSALSPQTYSFPETDTRDYKEGKSTKPKTMQDLLLASIQKSELIGISPKKEQSLVEQDPPKQQSVSPPPSQTPVTIDDLLGETVSQSATTAAKTDYTK